jgi:hypothetical protein
MDFLKTVKRRSFLSELVYVVLNIGLAVALMIIVRTTNSLLPAFALVLLSKWRILAVRPRFWVANIQANMVSIIVSISFVVLLYNVNLVNTSDIKGIIAQLILTALYIGWLLFLKPKSKRKYIIAQAGVALFLGITAIYTMAYSWIASPVVLLVWLVGYVVARHVLNSYDEDYALLLSLSWGLILAEIGWLAYHWTIAYRLPIINNMLLPQVSIVMLCLGFLAVRSYDSYFHHEKVRTSDILMPLIFTIAIIAVLMLAFNGISTGII